jgi:hypothetical protein
MKRVSERKRHSAQLKEQRKRLEPKDRGEGEALLLIVDNCEHVIAQAAIVANAVLAGCPRAETCCYLLTASTVNVSSQHVDGSDSSPTDQRAPEGSLVTPFKKL